MKNLFFVLIFTLSMFACEEDDCCVVLDTECYSFDIRQCQTDAFADSISENETLEVRESKMHEFLSEKGYAVLEVKLIENFHEAVCEACDSCPQGDRYYIRVNVQPDNTKSAERLRLLSFESDDCTIFD